MIYGADIIKKYFDGIDDVRMHRFEALGAAYAEWNARINVVSRKDFDSLYLHHILHSLAIAKVCRFDTGARIADVGCGGGFPSVPLAVMFPGAQFTAIDSIGKKIKVVDSVCKAVGIDNLRTVNARIESVNERFDYVVSRAVTDMSTFAGWVWDKIDRGQRGTLPNGILYLKGGDLDAELAATGRKWTRCRIGEIFDEEFFAAKEVVYTPKR